MKRILGALLLLLSGQVWAANHYVDPTCQNNGDGTIGTGATGSGTTAVTVCAATPGGAGPWNTWASATWTTSDGYYGKGGTTFTGACQFLVTANGSAGNPLIFASYGSGQHVMNCTSGNYVFGWTGTRAYQTIDNMSFISAAGGCLLLQGGDHAIVTRNAFVTCVGKAIDFDGSGATHVTKNALVQNNSFLNVTAYGIWNNPIATNSNAQDGIVIDSNYFGPNVSSASGNPIAVFPSNLTTKAGTITVTSGTGTVVGVGTAFNTDFALHDSIRTAGGQIREVLTITDATHMTTTGATPNWSTTETGVAYSKVIAPPTTYGGFTVTNNTFDKPVRTRASPQYAVRLSTEYLPVFPADALNCQRTGTFIGPKIEGNTFIETGGGVYISGATTNATWPKATIRYNSFRSIRANYAIGSFGGVGVETANNDIDGVQQADITSNFDGAGIDYDGCSSGGQIHSNYVRHTLGSTAQQLSGEGIMFFGATGIEVFGNVVDDAYVGIMHGNSFGSNAPVNRVFNNTVVNSRSHAYYVAVTGGQANIVSNNIFANSAGAGVKRDSSVSQVLANNLYWNNAGGDVVSNSADAAPVSANPGFDLKAPGALKYRLSASSPARKAGKFILPRSDFEGKPFPATPDIGAFQSTPTAPRVTR